MAKCSAINPNVIQIDKKKKLSKTVEKNDARFCVLVTLILT